MEAGAAEKSVEWSSPGEAMIVEGDHGLLRSAIENVRATPCGQQAVASVRCGRMRGAQVSIVIDDRGPGVPEPDCSASSSRSIASPSRATAIRAAPGSARDHSAHRLPLRRQRAGEQYA